jgi:hypothetical protein
MKPQIEAVIEKINELSPDLIIEVEDFVDFIRQRHKERALTHAAMAGSERALEKVWDNPEDADYDKL